MTQEKIKLERSRRSRGSNRVDQFAIKNGRFPDRFSVYFWEYRPETCEVEKAFGFTLPTDEGLRLATQMTDQQMDTLKRSIHVTFNEAQTVWGHRAEENQKKDFVIGAHADTFQLDWDNAWFYVATQIGEYISRQTDPIQKDFHLFENRCFVMTPVQGFWFMNAFRCFFGLSRFVPPATEEEWQGG